jgi:hypothetical protein
MTFLGLSKERGRGWGGGQGGEMTQILYAHVNKKIFKNTLK